MSQPTLPPMGAAPQRTLSLTTAQTMALTMVALSMALALHMDGVKAGADPPPWRGAAGPGAQVVVEGLCRMGMRGQAGVTPQGLKAQTLWPLFPYSPRSQRQPVAEAPLIPLPLEQLDRQQLSWKSS
ncbi:hypothetical protein ABBQ32_005286 [Trebouxia sp. C0010 RCD-2024]